MGDPEKGKDAKDITFWEVGSRNSDSMDILIDFLKQKGVSVKPTT